MQNMLTSKELYQIEQEKKKYENPRAASIEVLKMIQSTRGWLSDCLIKEISVVLCMSYSELDEIATFYNQIYRQPVGRNIIKFCDSVVCYMMGCNKIKKKLEMILKIHVGKTTLNKRFTLLPVSCLGNCHKAPILMINNNTYNNVKTHDIPILLEIYK